METDAYLTIITSVDCTYPATTFIKLLLFVFCQYQYTFCTIVRRIRKDLVLNEFTEYYKLVLEIIP